MLSDEMTTGGLSSNPNDKRMFAAKSHAWNIGQKRFRDAFPDVSLLLTHRPISLLINLKYSAPELRDLPNMAEKERGKPEPTQSPTPAPSAPSSVQHPSQPLAPPTTSVVDKPVPANPVNNNARGTVGTWAAGWRDLIWEKWRWGALIAIAVLVSRLSSN